MSRTSKKTRPRSKRKLREKSSTAAGAKSSAPRPKSSAANAGEWFAKLVAVQKRLRAPNGCPWDREQTHATLRTYLIEETYEVLEALDSGDDAKFAEEMGDLLLQVLFHSDIAREERRFYIVDVIRQIHDKMIRRHPHVFGNVSAKNSAEVLKNWEKIKAQERHDAAAGNKLQNGKIPDSAQPETPASILDGVPRSLPAALEALQLTRKAARSGFDWEHADGIFEKMREETAELRHALATETPEKTEEELGDLLFAAVNLARFLHIDPEIALKRANAKFSRRFREMEALAHSRNLDFSEVPRAQKESLWDAIKHQEPASSPKVKTAGAKAP